MLALLARCRSLLPTLLNRCFVGLPWVGLRLRRSIAHFKKKIKISTKDRWKHYIEQKYVRRLLGLPKPRLAVDLIRLRSLP
jgi:hypothetical protein